LRILVLTNLYPPHYIGGYELGCRDVAHALSERGHVVEILTSTYGIDAPTSECGVHRRLRTEWEATEPGAPTRWEILGQERINQRALREIASSFRPDVLYVWNLAQVSLSVLSVAEDMGLPIAYYVSDEWLINWATIPHRWSAYWLRDPRSISGRVAKAIGESLVTRVLGLRTREGKRNQRDRPLFRHVQFASQFLRDVTARAITTDQTGWEVIRWGIDTETFGPSPCAPTVSRLLYVGQVLPHKGVHTAVQAVQILRQEFGFSEITLSIVGPSTANEYVSKLQAEIAACDLTEHVHLCGQVDRSRLPQIYRDHDLVIFPSMWQEPFSITLLEALSSARPIVSTLTGGSGEILVAEVNALIFEAGDARSCATQIVRLITDTSMSARLAAAGRRTVAENYTMRKMVDRLENGLFKALN
jgi:glycogen synthase